MGYASRSGHKICNACKVEKSFSCFSATAAGRGDKFNLRSKCKECRSKENMEWHRKNQAKTKENRQKWLLANKEKVLRDAKIWREKNSERHKFNNQTWKANNPSKNASNASKIRAAKFQATPQWLSAIQIAQIQEFYDIALARSVQSGIKHHVDHIHPLMGDGYTGLHVPWNLRVITATENVVKKNRIPTDEAHLFWSNS